MEVSSKENKVIVNFREQCMRRGAASIKGIATFWHNVDDDKNRRLDQEEFLKGIKNHNIAITQQEAQDLFRIFDKDGSGTLDYEEFLLHLRPPLNSYRMDLIKRAYDKMDRTKDGTVTVDDLKGIYNVKKHPKYLNGEWTEEQIFKKFLETFEIGHHKDGIVTFDEFVLYYAGVSASIDSDAYFDIMMKNSWKI